MLSDTYAYKEGMLVGGLEYKVMSGYKEITSTLCPKDLGIFVSQSANLLYSRATCWKYMGMEDCLSKACILFICLTKLGLFGLAALL